MLQSLNLFCKEGVESGLLIWMIKLEVSLFDFLILALVQSVRTYLKNIRVFVSSKIQALIFVVVFEFTNNEKQLP
uniref:Uncharacterized protein n=1 Tax=Lepeophtheirus salmonis TaxID=72036 RepID=A0A0K2UUR3_LEPSM